MKVTSFEISKKLAEIGFRADFDWCYGKNDQDKSGVWSKSFEITCWGGEDISNYYPAYDLETLVDFLPLKIGGYGYFSIGARKDNPSMPFAIGYNLECDEDYGILFCDKIKKESLADAAARLLIHLYEANLVKFKEE